MGAAVTPGKLCNFSLHLQTVFPACNLTQRPQNQIDIAKSLTRQACKLAKKMFQNLLKSRIVPFNLKCHYNEAKVICLQINALHAIRY